MRVRTYVNFFNPVIYPNSHQITLSWSYIRSKVIYMGYTKAVLHTNFLPINPHGSFYMRTFQKEDNPFSFPTIRNCHSLLVPCHPDIMLVRRKKKRKFNLTVYTVLFHIRVEIVRAIVKASCPSGTDGYIIPFLFFGH